MARALCRGLVVAALIASCLGKTADQLAKEATDDFKDMKIVLLEKKGTNTSYKVGNEAHLLQNRDFVKSKQTVLYIHGALQSPSDVSSQTVTNALKKTGRYNLVLIDWSQYTTNSNGKGQFKTNFGNMSAVSERAGRSVKALVQAGLPLNSLWVVAHSMGAQMAAFVSRALDRKVPRLTALDPAGAKAPFLGFPHLVREDALFVDVIHTDAGTTFDTRGYDGDCGHIDFWPNNGRAIQPGCENVKGDQFEPGRCSHAQSYRYFAESILSPEAFPAVQCNTWAGFKSKKCPANKKNVAYMGYNASPKQKGRFFLRTGSSSPFGLGKAGLLPK
ncbi:pancreatic triacylglycerol lipase-like [Frankliniella occidentalis]|uniref:Pancreatic triacylglycerol lipase-like n=1 Tax=Frankliniella occidentalis TaxID=133901 RepID=A0A9C6XS83_FRAOC|nr:pancreatic triacylglycerol lipase-like [Frankliniella occidentalis]